MNDLVKFNALLDQYGCLLTDKQLEICQYYYGDDCSLSEISDMTNRSRASVSDLLNRVNKTLLDYESKLGLVKQHELISQALNHYHTTKDIKPLVDILEKRESEKI